MLLNDWYQIWRNIIIVLKIENKLAKARKMRKPPGTLSLKKFGLGNLWVEKVWTQNTCILATHFWKFFGQQSFLGQTIFLGQKSFSDQKSFLGQQVFSGKKSFWGQKSFWG